MMTDELLVKYLTGEAEAHEVVMINTWRNKSPENEKQYLQFLKLWENSAPLKASEDIDIDTAWQKIQGKINESVKGRIVNFDKKWWIAASVILMLGVSLFFFNNKNNAIEYASITAINDKQSITLSDGTNVTVKNGSFAYQTVFINNKRHVKLDSGTAFFNVTKNKEKPFEIQAQNTTITVVGTQFEVVSNKLSTQVLVTEGKVIFTTPNGEKTLTAGMGAIYNKKTNTLTMLNTPNQNKFAYSSGILNFKNESLKQVVEDLNNYQSNYKITIENNAIENCRITTEFENAALQDILAVIATTLDIQAQKDEATKTIVLKGIVCK